MLGLNDLAKETRARLTPGRAAFTPGSALCVAAARAHGCDVIDGVYNDIKDLDGFRGRVPAGPGVRLRRQDADPPDPDRRSATRPSRRREAEIAHAKAIIAAFDLPENAGKGVMQIDGRMVELLHAQMARRTLAIAEAIAGVA